MNTKHNLILILMPVLIFFGAVSSLKGQYLSNPSTTGDFYNTWKGLHHYDHTITINAILKPGVNAAMHLISAPPGVAQLSYTNTQFSVPSGFVVTHMHGGSYVAYNIHGWYDPGDGGVTGQTWVTDGVNIETMGETLLVYFE